MLEYISDLEKNSWVKVKSSEHPYRESSRENTRWVFSTHMWRFHFEEFQHNIQTAALSCAVSRESVHQVCLWQLSP